eukprot:5767807-Alexandrium_andersonii.AAC.1
MMRSCWPPNSTSVGSARVLLLAESAVVALEELHGATPAAGPGGLGWGRRGMAFFSPDRLRFGA